MTCAVQPENGRHGKHRRDPVNVGAESVIGRNRTEEPRSHTDQEKVSSFAFISPEKLLGRRFGMMMTTRSGRFLLRPQLLFRDQALHELGPYRIPHGLTHQDSFGSTRAEHSGCWSNALFRVDKPTVCLLALTWWLALVGFLLSFGPSC